MHGASNLNSYGGAVRRAKCSKSFFIRHAFNSSLVSREIKLKRNLCFFAVMLLTGALQGCDFLSGPDQPKSEPTATPKPAVTVQPSPSPSLTPLPPEVEPGSGQPIQVVSTAGSPAAPTSAPTIAAGQPAGDPWAQFREDCARRGGQYIPPSPRFGQAGKHGWDATGPQCQTREVVNPR